MPSRSSGHREHALAIADGDPCRDRDVRVDGRPSGGHVHQMRGRVILGTVRPVLLHAAQGQRGSAAPQRVLGHDVQHAAPPDRIVGGLGQEPPEDGIGLLEPSEIDQGTRAREPDLLGRQRIERFLQERLGASDGRREIARCAGRGSVSIASNCRSQPASRSSRARSAMSSASDRPTPGSPCISWPAMRLFAADSSVSASPDPASRR